MAMVELSESDKYLRHLRECIEQYGLIPLWGCRCGCWNKPEAARRSVHFDELRAQNAIRERRRGFRGMAGFRYRGGRVSHRPYWMLLDIVSPPSKNPECFCLVFHDEMVIVRGRDLGPLLKRLADSERIIIAEHDPKREQKPWPGVPVVMVESIRSYRKRPAVLEPH